MSDKPVMAKAYYFTNHMVIAFDQNGQQMPEYQGPILEVFPKIFADYPNIPIEPAGTFQ